MHLAIHAVVAVATRGLRQQPLALVVADGLGSASGRLSEFTDRHVTWCRSCGARSSDVTMDTAAG
jgi:hypothetical protein